MTASIVVFEFQEAEYQIPVGEARVIRKNLKDQHPEQSLLIESLGNAIAGDSTVIPLEGVAAQVVWDAVQPMNPPHGTFGPPFSRFYDAVRAKFCKS